MSILIKGMKMPKNCGECPFYYENKHDRGDDSFCLASGKETKCGCPLVELPDNTPEIVKASYEIQKFFMDNYCGSYTDNEKKE